MSFWRNTENQTVFAIGIGIFLGLVSPHFMIKFEILGEIFLRLLKMTIAPLIFASVYVSAAGLGSLKRLKEIGAKTLIYYLTTTSLAVFTGLVVVNILRPGASPHPSSSAVSLQKITFHDLILNLIPLNPVKSISEGEVLPIIFFGLLLGFATLSLPPTRRTPLTHFFEALNDALIVLIRWIIYLTPLGVFAIVGSLVAQKGLGPLFQLSKYVLAVVLGLSLHALFTLGGLLYLLGKERPWRYFLQVREALLVAFSTASSSATLPVSLEVATEKARIPQKIAGFVLPLGSTINMDGTALYEAVAALFIANVYHVSLSFGQQVLIFLTATLASIGAAGIPSAGLVTMTLVLQSVGLPLEGIGLILAVDRFLDMLRTSVNVWGDLIGAKIISRLSER